MLKIFGLKMNQGPWGPWSPEGSKESKGAGSTNSSDRNSDKKSNFGGDFFRSKGGSNPDNSDSGGDDNKNKFFEEFNKSPKKVIGLITLGAVLLWLLSGFYKIDSDENGVILYFGKFYAVSTPGLNYHIPYPFGKVIKQSVTRVNSEEFGYNSAGINKKNNRNFEAESLMLTGDENIVDIEFQVQWQVANIEHFTFNVDEPNLSIRKAAESAMREIIARTPISEALSDGKSKIEQAARDLLQQTLDSYQSGVRVILVQLRRVDPPSQVIDAFRDVQTAKADKEREINEAQSYANDIIPRARGNAAQMEGQAEAYRQQVIADAQGEANRFLAIYRQYINSRKVTRNRIYTETMEGIYRNMDKVVIDQSSSKNGVTPYFPVQDLINANNKVETKK